MNKSVVTVAISTSVAVALFVLSGFAPPVADAKVALPKGDRLLSRVVAQDCSKQMWPNFSVACLHGKTQILAVRMIPARG
jgi:hypothetical protein